MQYAIINGRTHELLAGITFYSIYSHLNWVETLMRQWYTATESCLPPGWPPRDVQMWSEIESRYSAAGGRSERSDGNAQAALLPAVYLSAHGSCRSGDGQLNDHRWCQTQAQHRAEATHVESCVQTRTNSYRYIMSREAAQRACWCASHGANYLNEYNLLLTIDCTVNKKQKKHLHSSIGAG